MKVARLLLDRGADVSKADEDGETPLYADRGADVNKAANNGKIPFLIASQDGHWEVVRLLMNFVEE